MPAETSETRDASPAPSTPAGTYPRPTPRASLPMHDARQPAAPTSWEQQMNPGAPSGGPATQAEQTQNDEKPAYEPLPMPASEPSAAAQEGNYVASMASVASSSLLGTRPFQRYPFMPVILQSSETGTLHSGVE